MGVEGLVRWLLRLWSECFVCLADCGGASAEIEVGEEVLRGAGCEDCHGEDRDQHACEHILR